MYCVNKNKGQSIENRGTATSIKVIGPLVQNDFDYIRNSRIYNLDLSEAEITEIGNDEDWDSRHINSFFGSNLKSVVLPKKLSTIKNWAFCYSKSLTSINIPRMVTRISGNAFSNCPLLVANIEKKGNFKIKDKVLYTKDGIHLVCAIGSPRSINIPNGVTSIGDNAFSGCTSLVSINIPSSVVTIGELAFGDCTSLASINIPNSVATISQWAFCNCLSNPRRCNMVTCECGYCYPEGELGEHQLTECKCGVQARNWCFKKRKEQSQLRKQKKM